MAEINEVISKVDKARQSKEKQELVPFDISMLAYPPSEWLHDKNGDELLKKFNHDLSPTPKWLDVYFIIKAPKSDPYYKLIVDIDEVKYSDEFLENDAIKRFGALINGASYDSKTGQWVVLGRREAIEIIESKTTSTLIEWGVYNDNNIKKVRNCIMRRSYDASLRNKNPFENIDPNLVVFKNGTYNFKTNAMQPNNPDDYILNYHDYEVDPTNNQAPETDKLLVEMVGDSAVFFKEYIGYCFYRSNKPFQIIMFLHGTGGQGKSTLINHIIKNIIGEDNIAAISPKELAESRFTSSQLYGKELNSVADIDDGYIGETAKLKKLTGDDHVNAEYKGIQNFKFYSFAKLLFSANSLPTFSDLSKGFKDRIKLINFINPDTREDPSWWGQFNMDLINDEAPAFAMECIQLFKKALDRHQWSETETSKQAVDEWWDSNDHFKEFIDEALIIDLSSDKGEKTTDITQAFSQFCKNNNYSDRVSTQTIAKKLLPYGVVEKKSRKSYEPQNNTNTLRFIGVKLDTHATSTLPSNK